MNLMIEFVACTYTIKADPILDGPLFEYSFQRQSVRGRDGRSASSGFGSIGTPGFRGVSLQQGGLVTHEGRKDLAHIKDRDLPASVTTLGVLGLG